MKILCLGCCHGFYNFDLEETDVLIITGDLTARDIYKEYEKFDEWILKQKAKCKIVIGGNHDMLLAKGSYKIKNAHYLENESLEFSGIKFFGIPCSLTFPSINPHCTAFTGNEKYMTEKCELIPDDIDILISHSPPFGILDEVEGYHNGKMINTGSYQLLEAIERVKPRLMFFSHIHEHGGKYLMYKSNGENPSWHIDCYNVSIMNENYKPVNKPLYLEI